MRMLRGLAAAGAVVLASVQGCGDKPAPPPPAPAADPEVDRMRLLQEAAARVKAEREARREQLRAVGAGTIRSKKLVGKAPDQKLEIEFAFTNKGDKELKQAEGSVVVSDASGTVIKSLRVPFQEPIAPGKSVTRRGKFPLDASKPGDGVFAKTPLKELKVEWIPELYRFPDGSQLQAE
jgi:hypothetical protein